jgi:hypothetical protein
VTIDEASAQAARERLRAGGIIPIEPDSVIGVVLAPRELVVAARRSALLERRSEERDQARALEGDLYVTTQRLLHLGRVQVECSLVDIREAFVAGGDLMLLVGQGRGMTIWVDDPSVLRVEIAAARELARRDADGLEAPGVGQDPSR